MSPAAQETLAQQRRFVALEREALPAPRGISQAVQEAVRFHVGPDCRGLSRLPYYLTRINTLTGNYASKVDSGELYQNSRNFSAVAERADDSSLEAQNFSSIADYFSLAAELAQGKATPTGVYQALLGFFSSSEQNIFTPHQSAEAYIGACLDSVGVKVDPQRILEFVREEKLDDFHHRYLARPFDLYFEPEIGDLTKEDFREIVARTAREFRALELSIATPGPIRGRKFFLLDNLTTNLLRYADWLRANPSPWFDSDERKLIALVPGPGAGIELMSLTRDDICVVVVDIRPTQEVVSKLQRTYDILGSRRDGNQPIIVTAGEYDFNQFKKEFTNPGKKGSAILVTQADFDRDFLDIPPESIDLAGTSLSFHHAKNLPAWLEKILTVLHPLSASRSNERAFAGVDGLPTREHLLRQLLPIGAYLCATKGWFGAVRGGLVSYCRALPPEIFPLIFEQIGESLRNIDLRAFEAPPVKTPSIFDLPASDVMVTACKI